MPITKCIVLLAFNTEGTVTSVSCGQWKCPECAKSLARKWAGRAKLHIKTHGEQAYFWTITMRGKYRDAKTAYRDLPKLWDTLRKIVQRMVGKWSYLAFVEAHPKRGGIPHFHIISMAKSPYRLKDLAHDAGFGFMAKEKAISGPMAASYVAKYASKTGPDVPKNFRRVRASQNWSKLPEKEGPELIVKAKKETQYKYVARVHDQTGIDIETLWERWTDAIDFGNVKEAEKAIV